MLTTSDTGLRRRSSRRPRNWQRRGQRKSRIEMHKLQLNKTLNRRKEAKHRLQRQLPQPLHSQPARLLRRHQLLMLMVGHLHSSRRWSRE